MLVELILKGGQADRLNEKMLVLEKRQKALKEFLGTAEVPPPLLHPEMATYYHDRVGELYAALKSEPQNQQMAVTEALRALVEKIILTPEKGVLQIDVRGDLAGILNISLERKKPNKKADSLVVRTSGFLNLRQSQVEVVAGAQAQIRSGQCFSW